MKNFIRQKLREGLKYAHVTDPTKDKFNIGIKEDYYDMGYDDDYGDIGLEVEPKKSIKLPNKIIAYHGSPTKINKFQDSFVGGSDATDQEGPGIYFTTSKSEAQNYGKYLYKVMLKPIKFVSTDLSHNLDYLTSDITKLIQMSSNWKRVAKNYDDGLDEMVAKYITSSESERDVFISLYNDVYINDPVSYVRNMVKLGYQGIYFKGKGSYGDHIVVYDPSIIMIG